MIQIIKFTSSLKKIQIKQKRSRRLRPKTSMMFYTVRQVCSSSLDLMTASILGIFFQGANNTRIFKPLSRRKAKKVEEYWFHIKREWLSKKVNSAQVSTKEAHSQTSSEPQLHISHLSTSDLSTEATDDTVPSSCIFCTVLKGLQHYSNSKVVSRCHHWSSSTGPSCLPNRWRQTWIVVRSLLTRWKIAMETSIWSS